MTDELQLGPHLLGRIPSAPDPRDYKLSAYLGTNADIVANAIDELKQTTIGYKNKSWKTPPSATHWAKALSLLAQIAPNTPTPPSPPTGDVSWDNPETILNQGNYGTCVGNGWAQFGNTLPIDDKFNQKDARAIYYEATINDGQPDDPDAPGGGQQGASVRGGAKAMKDRGRVTAYAFAGSLDEIKQWVRTKGALVAGTDWMNDMFNPDANGYVKPTGTVAGGHCYDIVGDLPGEGALLFQNSWGAGWGKNGRFKMKYADFQKLLDRQGEACTAVELALV